MQSELAHAETMFVLVVGLAGTQKTEAIERLLVIMSGSDRIGMGKVFFSLVPEKLPFGDVRTLVKAATEYRAAYGATAIAKACVKVITGEKRYDSCSHIFVDGVRSPEEVETFRGIFKNVIVLAFHSVPEIRYRFMLRHPESLAKTSDDFKVLDEFEYSLGIGRVILQADYMILQNDSETLQRGRKLIEDLNEFRGWLLRPGRHKHE